MTILGSLLKGRVLAGRYEVTSMLGRGGMGAVFEAHDQHLERTVAIKIIAIDLADTQAGEELRRRFYREARSAAGLQHPHLVTVYDLRTDEETGIDFIVMERLKGEDLEKRLERGVLNEVDWVLEVLLQAADALGAAHASGLVHRDVKPSNLFLEAGIVPRVRLMDFGIALVAATLVDSAPRLSRYGPPMTPAYAAPELLQGKLDVGPPCDVFSLAATGYELLTGERPFTDDELEMIAGGWAGRPASVADAPNVPADVAAVLEKALAHDPAARFADANEFADALREIKSARETAVTPVQPPSGLDAEQLGFHLTAVEMVSRTLGIVRGSDEMERLVLDSVGETFFAWWAGLYQSEGDQYTCRAVRSLRGESVAYAIPARVVRDLGFQARMPVIPPAVAEIHDHIPAEVAVVAPLEFGEGDAGLLILGRRFTDLPYEESDLALLRSLAEICATALRNAELLDRLHAQALVDSLTGCYNRRACDEFLQTAATQATRYGHSLCLVLFEIDRFQHLRDDFGQEVAENALQRIGRVAQHIIETDDRAFRRDGAEFALVLNETDKATAFKFAERLRILVESLPPNAEIPRPLTASVGIAVLPEDGDTPSDLWRSARTALDLARSGGGNRVH